MNGRVRVALIVLGSAAIAGVATHARSASTHAPAKPAATYWKCADGFHFERNGAAQVRCRKPTTEEISYPTQPIQINQGKP
jgi:hypothetical protein